MHPPLESPAAALLCRIKHKLERMSHPERIVLWAICCEAFFGFCHLGELLLPSPGSFNPRLHLDWGDMAFDNPQAPRMVKFHLKQSKTDQFGGGVDIIVGRTDGDLCPVSGTLAWHSSTGRPPGTIFSVIVDVAPHQATLHSRAQEDPDGAGPPGYQLCGP